MLDDEKLLLPVVMASSTIWLRVDAEKDLREDSRSFMEDMTDSAKSLLSLTIKRRSLSETESAVGNVHLPDCSMQYGFIIFSAIL